VPRVLEIVRANQAPMVLQGFSVVDEQRLMALGDADLLALVREGQLAWIYAHLMSLGNVSALAQRLETRVAAATRQASGAAESPASKSAEAAKPGAAPKAEPAAAAKKKH
jgi:hypothetical protein